jgi:hypothetical protein
MGTDPYPTSVSLSPKFGKLLRRILLTTLTLSSAQLNDINQLTRGRRLVVMRKGAEVCGPQLVQYFDHLIRLQHMGDGELIIVIINYSVHTP